MSLELRQEPVQEQTRSILVVEDDRQVYMVWKTLLTKVFGFDDVVFANNSQDAIELLKSRRFSCVSLDFDLDKGRLGGADNSSPVAHHIKDSGLDIVVIIHTGSEKRAIDIAGILGYDIDVDKFPFHEKSYEISPKCIWIDKTKFPGDLQYFNI